MTPAALHAARLVAALEALPPARPTRTREGDEYLLSVVPAESEGEALAGLEALRDFARAGGGE